MAQADGAMMLVRSELATRVAAIDAQAERIGTPDLVAEVDRIRAKAQAYGLYPAVAVIHALEAAIARGDRGPLIHGWLQVLADALDCGRDDRSARDTYLVAGTIRQFG
jgi:hypothetical protein